MRNRLGPLNRPSLGALAAALALAGALAVPACGDDDEDGATTTSEAAETTETTAGDSQDNGDSQDTGDSASGEAPSEEFCNALADFQGAQDGAQRNTALGEMKDALGDAGDELRDAIDQLETGDLDPSDYAEAAQALEDFGAGC